MIKNPFKFLDSYTKEDKNIFFGREHETEELYQKVFESKILLVYGVTGTGKTSLINCGLANKFNDSDWLPIYIRRNQDIIQSIIDQLSEFSYDKTKANNNKESILKLIQSVYLDNFKPIYLLFDQFEELFIFGNKEERKAFIELIDAINQSDIQCKCLFILREEFLANVTEFEKTVPEFFQNRIRIEKMSPTKALETIKGPCKAVGIEIQDKAAENILQKVSKDKSNVELTYLQVFLDKVYQTAKEQSKGGISITQDIVNKIGDVEDILGDFLEQQIKTFENSDDVLNILKSFVSIHGTKKQISPDEINDHLKTFGHGIDQEQLREILLQLVTKRILKEKDDHGRYELVHDAIAEKIYEKITLLEKELIEIKEFLKNAFYNYEKRGVLLSKHDLSYIAPYRDKLFLSLKETQLIEKSKREQTKQKRRRRIVFFTVSFAVIIILIGFSLWALNERNNAIKEREAAIEARALASEKEEENKRLTMILANKMPSMVIAPLKMNILYHSIENPVMVLVSGIESDIINLSTNNAQVIKQSKGRFIIKPEKIGGLVVDVIVVVDTQKVNVGKGYFRVKSLPNPKIIVEKSTDNKIKYDSLLVSKRLVAFIENFDFKIDYKIISFSTEYIDRGGYKIQIPSNSDKFINEHKKFFKSLRKGESILFNNIYVIGPDSIKREIQPFSVKIDYN